jgi:hypothetical protein
MALPSYQAIFGQIVIPDSPVQQQIVVALWMAINPILSAGTATNLASVQTLYRQILSDPQMIARVGFRIMSTVLASGTPTDATIQAAVSALIPAQGAFSL